MISVPMLRELYEYNYWARDRQLEACRVLTPEQFTKPMGSSFASVRDTLAHQMGAEGRWLQRWQCHPKFYVPTPGFLATGQSEQWVSQFPSVAAIQERWRSVESDVRQVLGSLTEEALTQPLLFTNIKGETESFPLWETLFHLANHNSYHRGQVTTLLRQLGAKPVSVDFIAYQRTRRKA